MAWKDLRIYKVELRVFEYIRKNIYFGEKH